MTTSAGYLDARLGNGRGIRTGIVLPSAPVIAAGGFALALAVAFLALPPSGTDLSAAVARADFARTAPFAPVDFRWYSGTQQFGYSLLAQYPMALLGPRTVGAISAVIASVSFAVVLRRTAVPRPVLGSLAGAACIFANLVSGRITYSIGIAIGLSTFASVVRGRRRMPLALAALTSATSPVAGLFVGVGAVSMLRPGHLRTGVGIGLGAAVPLVVTGLVFGQGGTNTMSWADTYHPLLLCLAVAAVVPHRTVRIAALLTAAGLVAAYLVPGPVGLAAARFPIMFAVPIVLACARVRSIWAVCIAAAMIVWQSPLAVGDWRARGDITSSSGYFQPLLAELGRRSVDGRVEVPPLRNYWDAVYLARSYPMARGWLRQLDTSRNAIFFDGELTASSYREWLDKNAVQYVAVASAEPSWVGRKEAQLVTSGLPYLSQVWTNEQWRLYAVADHVPVVEAPAEVLGQRPERITFAVPTGGEYNVRVGYSRWLTLEGPGCLRRAEDGTVLVEARRPGPFGLLSDLDPRSHERC